MYCITNRERGKVTDRSRADLFLAQELGVNDFDGARDRLAGVEIALALAPDLAGERLGQLTLLVAANILCRLGPYCPKIAIVVPDTACVHPDLPLLPSGSPLGDVLCRFMEDTQRPEKRSHRQYRVGAFDDAFALALVIGDARVKASRTLYTWYERWTGGFADTSQPITYRGSNSFGALLAGALGATGVSRLLLERIAAPGFAPQPLPRAAALSAYSYTSPSTPGSEPDVPIQVDFRAIGPLLLVGGGAVASGLAFALASLPQVVGDLTITDHDGIDATNLERHLIATWEHVGLLKATRVAQLFADGVWNGLVVRAYNSRYEHLPPAQWRTMIAAVDDADIRRRLQFDLPETLLNAGTVGPEFLVSRHDYGAGPCAECLYPEHSQPARTLVEMLAVQTGLDVTEVVRLEGERSPLTEEQIARIVERGELMFPEEVLERARHDGFRALAESACTTATVRPELPAATIGFVAALPGILLAAELVKEVVFRTGLTDGPPLAGAQSVFRFDTFGELQDPIELARPSRGCRCQEQLMRAAYLRRWRDDTE